MGIKEKVLTSGLGEKGDRKRWTGEVEDGNGERKPSRLMICRAGEAGMCLQEFHKCHRAGKDVHGDEILKPVSHSVSHIPTHLSSSEVILL